MNAFLSQFESNIKFSYSCFDRVILRGYIRKLFVAGAVVAFLRALGFHKISTGVMRILTDQLNKHIEKTAARLEIPVIWWDNVKKQASGKLEYVKKQFAGKLKNARGNAVLCILTARENVWTFSSREQTKKNGKKHHRLYRCKKQVKHYYIYVYDEMLGGPCYLKICSYIPFQCEFYFNGHNAIQVELTRRGIQYKMKDNAFVEVENPEALNEIARSLDGEKVLERVQYWMNIFFKFDKGTYSTRSKYLQHEWFVGQAEISTNVKFKSPRFCAALFEKLLQKISSIGLPDRICQIFGKRRTRKGSKSMWRLYDNNACVRCWHGRNSVKLYNKSGSFLRVETTINDPKSLGVRLRKAVFFLPQYLWVGMRCNNRFYDCCADVDVSGIDEKQIDRFNHAVPDAKGKPVAAPDLRKDRQTALFKELLKPKYCTFGFKTSTLFRALQAYFRNPAEIRYELRKLRARGVIKKKQGQNLYVITVDGWKYLWSAICAWMHFRNPMISKVFKRCIEDTPTQLSEIDEALSLLDQALSQIAQSLALVS